jgi:hypothetical protein
MNGIQQQLNTLIHSSWLVQITRPFKSLLTSKPTRQNWSNLCFIVIKNMSFDFNVSSSRHQNNIKQAKISPQKSEKSYDIYKDNSDNVLFLNSNFQICCQFNIKIPSMSLGKILSITVRSKYPTLV